MEWQDIGLIIAYQPLGEKQLIVTVLTKDHGRCRGVSRRFSSLALGTWVNVRWRGRLEDQLGYWHIEDKDSAALYGVYEHPIALRMLQLICYLANQLIPDRVGVPALYEVLAEGLPLLAGPRGLAYYTYFEMTLICELGYGEAPIFHLLEPTILKNFLTQADATLCLRCLMAWQNLYRRHWPHLGRLHQMRQAFLDWLASLQAPEEK